MSLGSDDYFGGGFAAHARASQDRLVADALTHLPHAHASFESSVVSSLGAPRDMNVGAMSYSEAMGWAPAGAPETQLSGFGEFNIKTAFILALIVGAFGWSMIAPLISRHNKHQKWRASQGR